MRWPSTILAAWTILQLTNTVLSHPTRLENEIGFLTDPGHTQFSLPLKVTVGLMGFQGDGGQELVLEPKDLTRGLSDALPVFVPANLALKQEGQIQYHMEYETRTLPRELLIRVQAILKANMKLQGETADGIAIFDIDARTVTEQLDEIYKSQFTRETITEQQADSTIGENSDTSQPPLVIFFLNPDKIRMNPLNNKPYIYRYRYDHSAPTQQWIAEKRYIFVDLAAGPLTYGRSDGGEGTVTLGTVPLVDVKPFDAEGKTLTNTASPKFLSELNTFIISAVRHVFAGDCLWRTLKYAEKVIVPIVVFRNHRRFHPLRQEGGVETLGDAAAGPVNEFKIDLEAIKKEVRKLLLPEQELLIVHGVHHLHEHHHISTAVFKALKQDSVHTSAGDGTGYQGTTRQYLDSAILFEELENASDDIVAGLMMAESNDPSSAAAATPIKLPTGTSSSQPTGHVIMPVFVLSLLGLPPEVLLDREFVRRASSRCVLVLQTAAPPVPVPFFTDGALITVNPRQVTRHIISGLASSLGGVLPPYKRYDTNQKRTRDDFLWSFGATPWGAFSGSSSLSLIFGDTVVRNSVTTRLTTALRAIQRSMDRMRVFEETYLDEGEDDHDLEASRSNFPLVRHSSANRGSGANAELYGVAMEVSTRLTQQLDDLEAQFLQVSSLITLNRWSTAHTLSGAILVRSRAFETYVANELQHAKVELSCCRKTYSIASGSNYATIFFTFFGMFTLAGMIYVALRLRVPAGPASFNAHTSDLLRPTIGALAKKPRTW